MLSSLPPQTAIVRHDSQPDRFPCWTVGSSVFYDADSAALDAQEVANETNDVIRVFLQRTRDSQRETWQRVEPERTHRQLTVEESSAIASETMDESSVVPEQTLCESHGVSVPTMSAVEVVLERSAELARLRAGELVGNKIELLKAHPFCWCCGKPVVAKAGFDNSASLVMDRLSCPGCVDKVRSRRTAERSGRPVREAVVYKPNSDSKRSALRKRLMAINPHCSNCKRLVRFNAGQNAPDSVSLVIDRLSCHDCVRAVRAQAKTEIAFLKKNTRPAQ